MRVKELTLDDVRFILDTYVALTGISDDWKNDAEAIWQQLKTELGRSRISEGYRCGSRWSGNSKLQIRQVGDSIVALFDPILPGPDRALESEVQGVATRFSQTVDEYLIRTYS